MTDHNDVATLLTKPREWYEERRKGLGGSDMKTIMEGSDTEKLALFNDKITPTPKVVDDPLARVLPVQLGSFTEPFNVFFCEQQYGIKILERNKRFINPDCPILRVEVDGTTTLDGDRRAVIDAKHCSEHYKKMPEKLTQRYYWQMQAGMYASGLRWGALSIIYGNSALELLELEYNEDDANLMVEYAQKFWASVKSGNAPVEIAEPVPPPDFSTGRTVDMMTTAKANEWAQWAADYIENEEGRKKYENAKEALKTCVEPDVVNAHGRGVQVKRSKAGSLAVSKIKPKKE